MLALVQRVSHANVSVDDNVIGKIDHGVLAFVGIERDDNEKQADRLLERILGYRMFSDENNRMNLNVRDVSGGLLLVSQFTLAADTNTGMRASFTSAAEPERAEKLFHYLLERAKSQHTETQTGQFGANMQINLCNDGPVTFMLRASCV